MTTNSTTESSFELARLNMVEQQIRPWDVSSMAVLDLFMRLHREDFVSDAHKALAFTDMELPLGNGEKMMSPKLEARILQALALNATDRVFELGTGSGFLTACLASLTAHVDSMEWHGELCRTASERLAAAGLQNVSIDQGDALAGLSHAKQQYDAIALTASFPEYPSQFEAILKPGGRMFVIVGKAPAMQAMIVTQDKNQQWQRQTLFETSVPAAHGLDEKPRFTF